MNNKKGIRLFAAAMLMAVPFVTMAHNGIEHVLGTLSAKTGSSVTVTTPKNTKVTILLDKSTTFSKDDAKASLDDLKVGERVVVNAKENKQEKLVGVSVRWGANSTAKDDHAH